MSGPGSPYDGLIAQSAQRYGIDPAIFHRQLWQESRLDPTRISPKGAVGIAQFMPGTAAHFRIDPRDPTQAIPAAAKYMRQLLDANGGSYANALASYNWGLGNFRKRGWQNAPAETVNYVHTILGTNKQLPTQMPTQMASGGMPTNINQLPPAGQQDQGQQQWGLVQAQFQPATAMFQPAGQTPPPDNTAQGQDQGQGQDASAPSPDAGMPTNINQLPPAPPQAQPSTSVTPALPAPVAALAPQPAPPWYSLSDVGSSAQQALSDVMRETGQTVTGNAFTDQPGQQQPQPQRSLAGDVTYSIIHSAPTLGAGIAGALGGGAIPGLGETGIGEVLGGAAGMGLMSTAQALVPAYREGRQQGMSPDDAETYAIHRGLTEGVISAATAPLFAFAPFKSALGKLLFTSFVTQPAVGLAGRLAEPAIMGEPAPSASDLARGGIEDVLSGAALGGAHMVGERLYNRIPAVAQKNADLRAAAVDAMLKQQQEQAAAQAAAQQQQGPSIDDLVKPPPPAEPQPTPTAGPETVRPVPPTGEPAPGAPTDQGGRGGTAPVPEPPPKTTAPPEGSTVGPVPGFVGPETTRGTTGQVAEGGPGTTRNLTTSDGKLTVPTRYEVVDASQLTPATGDLQPRDRATRAASDEQIKRQGANLDPSQLMASPTAEFGAPVVSEDGTVLAGNGRLASIEHAAEVHPDKYQAYVDAIKAAGHNVEGMKTPVLIRRATSLSPEDMRKFAIDSNVPRAATMSPVEQAKQDAGRLDDNVLANARPGDPAFEREWLKTIPPTEHPSLLDEKGRLSTAGQLRMKGALLAKAYGSDDLLKRALENPHDDTKGITNSLADVAPAWAAMRAKIASDQLPKDFDITPHLNDALEMVRQARENGLHPEDALNQIDAFKGAPDPITEQLYRSFYNEQKTPWKLNSKQKLTDILREYVQKASDYKPGKDLFGEETKPDPAKILKDAREGDKGLFAKKLDEEFPTVEGAPTRSLTGQEEAPTPEAPSAEAPTPEAPTGPDITKAEYPEDQPRLDEYNKRLEALGKNPVANKDQIEKLTRTRDSLLAEARGPVDTGPPKSLGSAKTARDYSMQHGTPVVRDAFIEAGLNPDLAINAPITQQVELLRQHTEKKFGFTKIEVGEKADLKETRDLLLDFHRAAQDMMSALEMPPRMVSMNGKLKLELQPFRAPKPRRKGTPYGSYAYGGTTKTITLHGRANSFGHEWTHALDHDMAETILKLAPGGTLMTSTIARAGLTNPADDMALRIGQLMNAIFHNEGELKGRMAALETKATEVNALGNPTQAAVKAQKELDSLKTGSMYATGIKPSAFKERADILGAGYWGDEKELVARTGESYIARRMEQQGLDPRGVLKDAEGYANEFDYHMRMAYPHEERIAIIQAWDRVMDGYRQEALAGSPAATQALRGGISDPSVYARLQPNADKGVLGALRQTVQRTRNYADTLKSTALTDPNRPPPANGRDLWYRTKQQAKILTYSLMGILESMHETLPENSPAREALQKVMDRLGTTAGSGRYTGFSTLEERAIDMTKHANNRFANIFKNNGFDPGTFSKEQRDMLRHVMTTGQDTFPTDPLDPQSARIPIDKRIQVMAGQLRPIMDEFFEGMKKAGVNIGYARSGYFLRLYDSVKAMADPDGFKKAAGTLFRKMFDNEVGQPGDDPGKLLEQWQKLPSEHKSLAPQSLQDAMKDLATVLRKHKNLTEDIAANGSTPAKQARLDALARQAEDLARDNHDDAGDHNAQMGAENWLHNLRTFYAKDFERTGPSGHFLNARTLPPEADQIMRDFMITDPLTVLPRYFDGAARKIAYAEAFGADHSVRKTLLAEMSNGGMHPEDVAIVDHIIDLVSGNTVKDVNSPLANLANFIHSGAAVGLMPRAVWSMLAEPFVTGLAHGDMRAGFIGLLHQFSAIMGTKNAETHTEMADWIRTTVNALHDDIYMNRVGADYSDSPQLGKLMTQFYRATWITQVTNANRRAAQVGADWLLKKVSRDLTDSRQNLTGLNKREEARNLLNELGVDPKFHNEFAQWRASINGLPDIDAIENHRFGPVYARALQRMVDRSIIDPKKMDRPLLATSNPWLKLIWQFQSYNYGFQRNVLNPIFARAEARFERGKQYQLAKGSGKIAAYARGGVNAAWSVGHVGAIAGAYVGINILTSAMRQYIFNQDDWKKHEAAGDLHSYLTDLAMSRSGLSGTLDPVMQVATNLRYNSDLTSLLLGAAPKWYAKNAYDLLSGFANPTGDVSGSNVRYHNAVKGFYNLIGTPLEAYIATKLAAFGPVGLLAAGVGEQYFTSPQFADSVATAAAGVKGTKLPTTKPGELPTLPDLGGLPEPPKPGEEPQAGSQAGISGAQGLSGTPWGMLDDVAVPMWRIVRPIYNMIPPRVKTVATLGALGYGGYRSWEAMAPYRNAPPPKEKSTSETVDY